MNVAVYGAGGVGGYVGARLANEGVDVHLIARGAHLDAIRSDGLCVESVHGSFDVDVPATDDPRDVGPCSHVLFCVKSYDTTEAAQELDPLIGEDTAVCSLQNGVDNEDTLATVVGREHVMGGLAYIFSEISEPGVIAHTGGPARIIFGELDGTRSDRAVALEAACDRATGLDGQLSTDIWADMWEKYVFICALSGTTAAIRLPIGEIRDVEASWTLFRELLEDGVAVAAGEGITLSDDIVDSWLEFVGDLESDATSSLHYDMTNGNRMELEALHGTMVRTAADHDLSVPRTETIYSILRPWAVRNERGQN